MSYLRDFFSELDRPHTLQADEPFISKKTKQLAEEINKWHEARQVPERWKPVQLGRIAAQFNTSRENAAVAMQHLGWTELKTGANRLWKPRIN